MEQFSDLIKNRRSMRKFTDEELSQDQVVALLKAALMSPSSKRSNPWQFVVVDDKETLLKLSLCKEMGASFLKDATLGIVVMADPLVSDVWIEDASTAAMTILYQAEDLGLGACWVQIRDRQDANGTDSESIVRDILSLSESKRVVCLIALGHKGMERKGQNLEKIATLKAEKVTRL